MPRTTSRGIGQLVTVIAIVMLVIGILFTYFAHAKKAALDAKKKAELKQLYTLLQFYYVGENTSPINPAGDEWCVINDFYDAGKCLQEVVRDGYAEAIPQSFDDAPYLYHDDQEKFLVATQMVSEDAGDCLYSEDPRMWCKVFLK